MTVASVREEGGRVLVRSIFPTEERAILQFFRGMRGTIHVTFVEGFVAAHSITTLFYLLRKEVGSCRAGCEMRAGNSRRRTGVQETSAGIACQDAPPA